jgi:hypothetical protein
VVIGGSDTSAGADIERRLRNTTSDTTTAWVSGNLFIDSPISENTSYSYVGDTRDPAGNINSEGTALTVITPVIPMTPPTVRLIRIGTKPDKARVFARPFPNVGTGLAAYNFYRWDGEISDPSQGSASSKQESGWLTSRTYDYFDIESNKTYTFGVQARNQDGTLTNIALTTWTVPAPAPPPDLPKLGAQGFLQTGPQILENSPLHRWSLRLEELEAYQTTYGHVSTLVSQTYHLREAAYQIRLSVIEEIPETYPDGTWIEYAVSFDNQNPPVNILPNGQSVLVINSLLDSESRALAEAVGWIFVDLEVPVTRVKLHATFRRPEDQEHTTPILHRYVLRVRGRSNLHQTPLERGNAPQPRLR